MPLNYARTAFLLGLMTLLFVTVGYVLGGQGGMVIAFVLALGMNLFSLFKSDTLVLRMHGAKLVDAATGGDLYMIVQELAQRAELPMPKVAVMQNPQPNAFATGRNPENSTVAVSTGLLEMLSREEVAGVLAHELAHIKNRDTLTMTAAASLGGAISMVAQFLQFGALFGRGSGSRFGWVGFLFAALVAPFAAMMVQMAISRSREYQADRMGAMISGQPEWLASALLKIHAAAKRIRNPTAEAHRSSAHLFIVNPLTGGSGDSWFATHPRIENRIAELEKIAAEMAAKRDKSRGPGPSVNGTLFPDRHRSVQGPTFVNPDANGLAARRLAIYTVDGVVSKGQSLDEAFNDGIAHFDLAKFAGRDRGFARLIATTTLRHLGSLEVLFNGFLDKPLAADAGRTRFILATAAAQLLHLETPPHAAISQAVDLARIDHTARRFDRLVNAVLRRVAAEGKPILSVLDTVPLDIPSWLWTRWVATHGEDTARKIGIASLIEPPLDLSVKGDPVQWATTLTGVALPTGSVRVREAGRIEDLPGFADGGWWVQDAAAALPVRLLGDIRGKRVADLCAAPGGKTAQLLSAGADVTAVDASGKRNERLAANLQRLGMRAEIVKSDVAAFANLPENQAKFDAVLLDAPCSATGTIRRHPDLMHTKAETEIARLAVRQGDMLAAAIKLLSPGGRLVYATCSLEPEEGEANVDALLASGAPVHLMPADAHTLEIPPDLVSPRGFLRTLPHQTFGPDPVMTGMDGFFAAAMMRRL